jgi:hypothetical protein
LESVPKLNKVHGNLHNDTAVNARCTAVARLGFLDGINGKLFIVTKFSENEADDSFYLR